MSEKHLMIIDPQIDFCDPGNGEGDPNRGTLYVPGAEKDMEKMANFVRKVGSTIDKIHVTIDSHYLIDVAHPQMWRDSDGNNPAPFTLITSKDIVEGRWTPIFPNLRQIFINYTSELESGGKYLLIIWPPHCLIGSRGQAVMPSLFEALVEWQNIHKNNVNFVTKGSNPKTEHYSPIRAEVVDPDDPNTQINTRRGSMVQVLQDDADIIYTGGEALSHCLKAALEDLVEIFGDEHIKKFCLLRDTTSPVPSAPGTPDFPAIAEQFIIDMKAKGMQTALTTDF